MAKKLRPFALKQMSTALSELVALAGRINRNISVHPNDPVSTIRLKDSDDPGEQFALGPLVMKVPEKASQSGPPNIFVVVRGTIRVEYDEASEALRTLHYSTNIAYFREKRGALTHIFGAHYDFDDKIAHPIFHAQVSSHAEEISEVTCHHHGLADEVNDLVKGVLNNVRLPTAQMDFYSVLLQIFSDHLVNEGSSEIQKSHYQQLLAKCSPIKSYGREHVGIGNSVTDQCVRSPYWYQHS